MSFMRKLFGHSDPPELLDGQPISPLALSSHLVTASYDLAFVGRDAGIRKLAEVAGPEVDERNLRFRVEYLCLYLAGTLAQVLRSSGQHTMEKVAEGTAAKAAEMFQGQMGRAGSQIPWAEVEGSIRARCSEHLMMMNEVTAPEDLIRFGTRAYQTICDTSRKDPFAATLLTQQYVSAQKFAEWFLSKHPVA